MTVVKWDLLFSASFPEKSKLKLYIKIQFLLSNHSRSRSHSHTHTATCAVSKINAAGQAQRNVQTSGYKRSVNSNSFSDTSSTLKMYRYPCDVIASGVGR
jgi:hypothetical protein